MQSKTSSRAESSLWQIISANSKLRKGIHAELPRLSNERTSCWRLNFFSGVLRHKYDGALACLHAAAAAGRLFFLLHLYASASLGDAVHGWCKPRMKWYRRMKQPSINWNNWQYYVLYYLLADKLMPVGTQPFVEGEFCLYERWTNNVRCSTAELLRSIEKLFLWYRQSIVYFLTLYVLNFQTLRLHRTAIG